jgi:peptidoglycan/xylan/chitin deacetylase (PgdA/CDA1 family)
VDSTAKDLQYVPPPPQEDGAVPHSDPATLTGNANSPPHWTWPEDQYNPAPKTWLKSAKLMVLKSLERLGVFEAVRDSRWRGRRLLILGYHGVSMSDEHEWNPPLYMPLTALRRRFELIRSGGYTVLPLKEAVRRLGEGTLPPRAVAITFDDGTVDFTQFAVPLLREFGYPATVYITTYYAEKQTPVFRTAVRYLLWVGRGKRIDASGLVNGADFLSLDTPDRRERAARDMDDRLHQIDGGIGDEMEMLRLLADRVGFNFDRFLAERRRQIMSAEEIRELPGDLVDVQLHTHRHRTPLLKGAFLREIEDNRQSLVVSRPGEKLDAFCYPNGWTDERFLPWLRELGIETATTCEAGLAADTDDRLLLPRLVDSTSLTRLEFKAWLSGVASLLPMRKAESAPAQVYPPAPVTNRSVEPAST